MKKELILVFLLFVFVTAIFFYPVFKGLMPFPGDLLVGEYSPYNSYSFSGYAPGGFPNKGQDFDVLRLLYPAKEFSIRLLKNFELPFWNPYNFSGNPHLASLQSGSFYPLNIILFLFPFSLAWSVYIFIQPVLAGFFTYLLLREFKLTKKSSIFGGLIFAFSAYFVVWMEYGNIGHSIIWLPLLFWLSLRNVKKPTINKSIIIIFALTFSILAGYIQTSFYVFIFLFTFYVFNLLLFKEKKIINFLILIPLVILPLLLSLFQLFPMLELFNQSSRASYSYSTFISLLIPSWHTATLFVPDFFGNPATRNYWVNGTYIERVSYVGMLPLLFILYSFVRKKTILIWFFAITLVVTYLISFDTFLSRLFYSFNLPFISTAVPTRLMFVFSFSASILAAFGMDNLEKGKTKVKSLYIPAILIGVVFVFLWIFVFQAQNFFKEQSWVLNLSISKRNLILPTIFFAVSVILLFFFKRFIRLKNYIVVIFFILTIFDLYYFFQKITPFSPVKSIYPKTEVLEYLKGIQGINRSWGYGSAYMDANIQTVESVFSTNGYDALHIKRYGELLSSSKNGHVQIPLSGSSADIASGYGENDLKNNYYRQRILNFLGVKYILHKVNSQSNFLPDLATFPENNFQLVWQKGIWQIYENKQALPRIFLAGSFVVEKNRKEIIKDIYNKDFPIKEKIIFEEDLPRGFNPKKDEKAEVKLVNYSPNKIDIETISDSDMILFLSDNYYPGWKASIDGINNKIYRADYSFRALPVKKGNHNISFWYYPKSFSVGFKISVITFCGILFFVVFAKIKKYV